MKIILKSNYFYNVFCGWCQMMVNYLNINFDFSF